MNEAQKKYAPGGIFNFPIYPGNATSQKWRKKFSNFVIPNLIAFQPDFILISAGFDAHEKDFIHDSKDTRVTEFEYQWLTNQIMTVANKFCEGRVISVLEGGYHTRSGPISPLA